jgi:hypothetical protein
MCKFNYFDVLCNISFKEHLPDDGDNRRPKHVAGYAVSNTKKYISAYALVGCISHNESLVHGHESSKINTALTDRQRQT